MLSFYNSQIPEIFSNFVTTSRFYQTIYTKHYETNKLTGKKPPEIPFVPEFYKYWFVYIIFALLVCSLIVNFKLQSVVIASIGAILCSFVLFFSRVLRVRRGLGLKIFCPVTLGWLKTLYVQVHFPEISQTTKQTKKDGLNVG